MSATLDAESFSRYFTMDTNIARQTPLLSVPPKPRHPVELHYLEDILETTQTDNVKDDNGIEKSFLYVKIVLNKLYI